MKKTFSILLFLIFFNIGLWSQSQSPFVLEKGNTKLQFGGFVRTVAFADFEGSVPHYDFRNAIMNNQWHNDSRLSVDASATRLSFKAIQKTERLGNIEFYVESDFRGGSDALRLRQAYISFKGLIAGQTWSFMNDLPSNAPTIDVQGVNSRTFLRTPLIGYRTNLSEKLSFGVALEFPSVKYTTNTELRVVNQRFPDIPIYLQLKGKAGHIKLAGMFRAMDYGLTTSETVETKIGIGAQLSGTINVTDNLTLFSQGIVGRGVSRYINDLALLSVDLVPNVTGLEMQTLPMYSISLGFKGALSKNVYASSSISRAGFLNNQDYYLANEYYHGSYFSFSLFWDVIKNMTLAAEYLNGSRTNMDDTKNSANRVQMMFMYKW